MRIINGSPFYLFVQQVALHEGMPKHYCIYSISEELIDYIDYILILYIPASLPGEKVQ